MATKKNDITVLGRRMQQELDNTAGELATRVFGKVQPDSQHMTKAEYAEYVRRNWDNPLWNMPPGTNPQQWLIAWGGPQGAAQHGRVLEADRSPNAFLEAFRTLGGVIPGEAHHSQTLDFGGVAEDTGIPMGMAPQEVQSDDQLALAQVQQPQGPNMPPLACAASPAGGQVAG